MDRQVERIVERDTGLMDICTMAMMLYALPRPAEGIDAIAVLPGLGETWRLVDAVNAWEASTSARNLIVVSTYRGEKTQLQPTIENLSQPPVSLRRHEGVRIQDHAHHTKEQTDWLVSQIAELGTTSLALYVSPFHLLRGYGTLLKSFAHANQPWIPMIPMPVTISPDTLIPETGVNAWDMVAGEIKRIEAYQEKGDVATYKELKEYLSWLWQQPIIARESRHPVA